MKCWNSAFNAQGSRVIIVIVQVGIVKMYVAEVVRQKGRTDETQFTTKPGPLPPTHSSWMLMYYFAGCFWISPCVWPNSGFWCCVFITLHTTPIVGPKKKLGVCESLFLHKPVPEFNNTRTPNWHSPYSFLWTWGQDFELLASHQEFSISQRFILWLYS
jgi:hypothetical protein